MPRNPECTACPLHKQCASVCIWGECISGHGVHADEPISSGVVLVLGEAPGADEDRHGRPWIGRAGTALRKILSQVPSNDTPWYLTNVCKCRPPKNRKPRLPEIRACSTYWKEEIHTLQPKAILAVGATAIKALSGERTVSVNEYRNRLRWSWEGIPVVATYHPAAALRNPSLWPKIIDDVYRCTSDEIERPEEIEVRGPIPGHETCWPGGMIRVGAETVALDLETTGLNPFTHDGKILASAVSTVEGVAYAQLGQGCAWVPDDWTLVGHNIKFDLLWLREKQGFKHQGDVIDTMVVAHLLDENAPSRGLKWLASQYTGLGEYDAPVREARAKGRMQDVDWDDLIKYVGYDAGATYLIYRRLWPEIKRQGLEPLVRAQGRVVKALVDIEHRGLWVDRERLGDLRTLLNRTILDIESRVTEQYPIQSLRSAKQVGNLLHQTLRFPVFRRTPTGAPSTDEATLRALQKRASGEAASVLSDLLQYRESYKWLRSYLDPIEEGMDTKGRIHPSFNVAGTVTGRLACSKPNLQNFPRDRMGPRQLVVAGPGKLLYQADYSQMELRIMAELSQDATMLGFFQQGLDLHMETAKRVFSTDTPTKDQRSLAKTVNFGILYGAGANRIAEETGLPLVQAHKLIRDWFGMYPGIDKWLRKTAEELLDIGEIKTIFGRKRRLPKFVASKGEQQRMIRQACNFPIQSTAAEICLLAMTRLNEYGIHVVGNIHDAVLFEADPNDMDTVRHVMVTMSDVNTLLRSFGFDKCIAVPLPVEVSGGRSWAEQETLEV